MLASRGNPPFDRERYPKQELRENNVSPAQAEPRAYSDAENAQSAAPGRLEDFPRFDNRNPPCPMRIGTGVHPETQAGLFPEPLSAAWLTACPPTPPMAPRQPICHQPPASARLL